MKWKIFLSLLTLGFLLGSPSTTHAQNAGFVYLANAPTSGTAAILGFAINPSTGALTPVPGSPYQTSIGNVAITQLAVTPSGRFLYVPEKSASGYVAAGYSIDPNTGALSPVPGSPFSIKGFGTDAPSWFTMHPSGKFIYVMDFYDAEIYAFAIDPSTGALSVASGSPFPAPFAYPIAFAIDATGSFAYTTFQPNRSNAPSGAVAVSSIDPATGALTQVSGSPFIVPKTNGSCRTCSLGPNLYWVATNPAGGFLYVLDTNQLDVWTFAINGATGALTLTPSSPLRIPNGANQFTFDPSGRFAYFTSNYPNPTGCANFYPYTDIYAPNSVFVYNVAPSTGALSPASSPLQAAGYEPNPVAVDRSGRFAYVVNLQGYNFDPNSSNVSAFTIDSSGALTPVSGSPFASGSNAAPSIVIAVSQSSSSGGTGGTPPPTPQSVFASSTTPAVVDVGPDSPVELGLSFTSDTAGYILGIRFYKSANNSGTHVANLWSNNGTLLASATFANETASGWQQVNFSTPVAISANTVYRASYHSTVGHYSITSNYFATSGTANPPLHALANGPSTPDGPFCYGSTSCFPSSVHNASNYWVDVIFSTSPQ